MIELSPLTICGQEYRVRQTSERMGVVLVLDADGEILGRGASRVQAVRDARMNYHRLPADVITATDLNALTVDTVTEQPAAPAQRVDVAQCERTTVARLELGDRVSFQPAGAKYVTVNTVTDLRGARVGTRNGYHVELANGDAADRGASTAVWVLR